MLDRFEPIEKKWGWGSTFKLNIDALSKLNQGEESKIEMNIGKRAPSLFEGSVGNTSLAGGSSKEESSGKGDVIPKRATSVKSFGG